MNKANLESVLRRVLKRATRGVVRPRPVVGAPSLNDDELSNVSGGSDRSRLVFEGFQSAIGSSRGSRIFEGFDLANEGRGFVFANEGPGFVEFTEPDFLQASPPEFIEFTEPDFIEATPPRSFPGFGGGLR